jgi:Zn-dependent protease
MQGFDLAKIAIQLAFALIPMVLSLSVHECAHALAADLLGDRTARDAGRLTLNPQAHIDPWGTLFIPAVSVLMGGLPYLGWARPTPVKAMNFREGVHRRWGIALVAAAGPLSNVALSLASLSILALLQRAGVPLSTLVQDGEAMVPRPTAVALFLFTMFELNLGLAFFNLLPIPPLDGYRLLPPVLERHVRPLERYGFALIMLAVLMLPQAVLAPIFRPLYFVMDHVQAFFGVT